MSKSPPTRASLLIRLRDRDDQAAWGQFVEIYAPLVFAYGIHRGLQEADAADLVQEVLQSVAGSANRFNYDPQRGSFRGWLFTIARNALHTMHAKQARRKATSGGTEVKRLLDEQPALQVDEEEWNRQHQLHLFDWASKQVRSEFRESTWRAFWATAVENRSGSEVADELGLSVGAVYIARSRVLARVKAAIESVESE